MTKAGAGDWKTPLGYYERAIAELIRTREGIRTELQNFKEISQIELQTLKVELQSSYQAELQTTKDRLATTQQTADEALARVATAESAANAAQTELQSVKAELQILKAELQTTKERLATTQQTADAAQTKLASAEKAANVAQTELQALKAELQTAQNDIKTIYEVATNLPIEELIWLKQNIGGIKQLLGVFGRK